MKYAISFVATLLFSITAFSQNVQLCGSPQKENEQIAARPEILIEKAKLQQFVHDWIAANPDNLRDAPQYIIPVVFHIIHDYGTENITDDQVHDAIRILNEDYRKLNADTSSIITSFKDIAADTKIEFRLANKTSGGQCTSGIDHVHSLSTYVGGDNAKLDDWPRNMYLNVWTVKQFGADLVGVAGYAYLPSTAAGDAPNDGVIILSSYVGSIGTGSYSTARSVTHEIGHVLGLSHPWGDTNSPGVDCGDDNIDDTPITKGWSVCNLSGSVCYPPIIENVQNYMDYSYCSRMFSIGQSDAMHATLNYAAAGRNNLWTTANLNATGTNDTIYTLCTPKPDFYSNYGLACTGTSVFFHDVSWSGAGASRTWTFQDGTPATSTDQNPSITFSSTGWKTVSLTVNNAAGSATDSRTNYIYISDNSAGQYPLSFTADFNDPNQFNNDWIVQNREGNSSKWQRVTTAGYNDGTSAELNNYHNMQGDIDNLITPSFDLTSGGTIYLNFRYTCANNTNVTASVADALNIYSTTNCGQTWFLRATIKNTDLANVGFKSTSYDGSGAWIGKSILLTSSLFQPAVRFKFEYKTNGKGNNIYIDNVQLQNNPVGVNDPDAVSFSLNVFPNPLTESSVAILHQKLSGNMNLRIVDITGRTQKVLFSGYLTEGEHRFNLNTSDLNGAGMYFLVADDGITLQRQKLVVE